MEQRTSIIDNPVLIKMMLDVTFDTTGSGYYTDLSDLENIKRTSNVGVCRINQTEMYLFPICLGLDEEARPFALDIATNEVVQKQLSLGFVWHGSQSVPDEINKHNEEHPDKPVICVYNLNRETLTTTHSFKDDVLEYKWLNSSCVAISDQRPLE